MTTAVPEMEIGVGSMSARLVAALSGASLAQLRRWRRSGIVSASALPPRRGVPCAYRWDEFRRARLAALLLTHGLQPRRLRPVLDEYCELVDPAKQPPTTVADQRAIIKPEGSSGYTAERAQQGVWFDFVWSTPLDESGIAEAQKRANDTELSKVLHDFAHYGPLGAMEEYRDVVQVRPDVMDGSPTLIGSRLETAALAALHQAGDTVEAIARAYGLTRAKVERVLAFERALDACASPTG